MDGLPKVKDRRPPMPALPSRQAAVAGVAVPVTGDNADWSTLRIPSTTRSTAAGWSSFWRTGRENAGCVHRPAMHASRVTRAQSPTLAETRESAFSIYRQITAKTLEIRRYAL